MTLSELYDYIKQYIDTKIGNLRKSLDDLFSKYKVKTVADNIDTVNSVGSNMDMLVTNKDNIAAIGSDIDNINALKNYIDEGNNISHNTQLLGSGSIKGIEYLSKMSIDGETIEIQKNLNAFSVDSFEIGVDTTLIIDEDSVYKIL